MLLQCNLHVRLHGPMRLQRTAGGPLPGPLHQALSVFLCKSQSRHKRQVADKQVALLRRKLLWHQFKPQGMPTQPRSVVEGLPHGPWPQAL